MIFFAYTRPKFCQYSGNENFFKDRRSARNKMPFKDFVLHVLYVIWQPYQTHIWQGGANNMLAPL